jgi:hypothetical protein
VTCADQTRLIEDFDEADRAWLACRTILNGGELRTGRNGHKQSWDLVFNRIWSQNGHKKKYDCLTISIVFRGGLHGDKVRFTMSASPIPE